MTARPIRDCQHPQTFHPHGSRNAYVCDKCRCAPCTAAGSRYSKSQAHAKATGRYGGLVDAEPVREHVRRLSEAGVGLKQITRQCGVSGGVLTKLVYGHPNADGTRRAPSRRCTPSVRDRVLSVTADAVAGGVFVDSTGTRRRLEALVCVGWSQQKLAHRLGMAGANMGKVFRSRQVTVATAKAVAALYEELWNTPPAHTEHRDAIAYSRARNQAAMKGWLPPLAWDDDTIDNPNTPTEYADADDLDEIAIERIMGGTLTIEHYSRSEERIEAVRRLVALGLTDLRIGERIGVTTSAVYYIRMRHDIQRKVAA